MCKCQKGISGAIITKRKGREAKVDLVELGKAAGISTGGFLASNYLTFKIKETYEEANKDKPDAKPFNLNYSGITKLVLAAGTAYAGAMYAPKNTTEIVSGSVGMAVSGMVDLAKQNFPEESPLRAALGLNASPVMPDIFERRRQRRRSNTNTGTETSTRKKVIAFEA